MSDFEVQVINEPSENLTGLVIDGVAYLYWLRVYKVLGLDRSHAKKVISRLTQKIHYIELSKSELEQKFPTVSILDTVDKRASTFIFITDEGYHRAIIEIGTGHMADKAIAEEINRKKDHIAHIYAKYQRGELEQIETPVIQKIQEKRDIGTNLSKQIGRVVKEYLMPEYVRKGLNPHTAFSREHRAINTITNGKHEADLKNKLNSDGLDVQNAAKLLEVGFIESGLYDDETRWGNTERTINIVYPNRFNERIKLNEKELTLIKRGCTETQRSLGEFNPSQKRISGAV